jgi:hypothetical protein
VPKPNPGKTGDDKNKHENNENISFDSIKLFPAVSAYGHGKREGVYKEVIALPLVIRSSTPNPPRGASKI